jgi:carbamoyltransferase
VIYQGIAHARLGPASALVDTDSNAVAACEENRLTRGVDSGAAGPPELATAELLRFLGRQPSDIAQTATIEEDGGLDPHRAHAEYAYRASGFESAVVLVCDAHAARGWTAWELGSRADAVPVEIDGNDQYPIAASYTQLTRSLGYRAMRDEHFVEALARAGHPEASTTQRRLGDDLETLMTAVRAKTSSRALCLSGGLFFNTSFTTRAASSGVFERTYVPAHPGRNGAAMGAALLLAGAKGASGAGGVSRTAGASGASDRINAAVGSPYLGPSYSDSEIKATLENCKLSFDLLHEERLMDVVLHALSRGRLAGWYHGRLEWGPRALGHRSVLADPFAPHVLENLNGFLKRRPSYRTYGVSVPRRDLDRYFDVGSGSGAESSPFMQFEYRPRDPGKFRPVLPKGVQSLRVHTVDDSEPKFLRLLELWGERTGAPVLVNTSFNGFHEPLVCSPRDAIRVFYGTGLDVLALENFYLHK